jgi:endonuclease YncB( thermonuclease family)
VLKKRVICLMLLLTSGGAYSGELAGQVSIIDGDTLEIHGTRICLWGIDAPESSQLCRGEDSSQYRCGAQAANQLDALIAARLVNCAPINLDR